MFRAIGSRTGLNHVLVPRELESSTSKHATHEVLQTPEAETRSEACNLRMFVGCDLLA